MIVSPEFWPHVILYGKIAGAFTAFSGIVYGIAIWFSRISETNRNVALLTSNHLPHLQEALDSHGDSLRSIKSDFKVLDTKVEGMSDRINDTKVAVHTLGQSFLTHLENESTKLKKARKR